MLYYAFLVQHVVKVMHLDGIMQHQDAINILKSMNMDLSNVNMLMVLHFSIGNGIVVVIMVFIKADQEYIAPALMVISITFNDL